MYLAQQPDYWNYILLAILVALEGPSVTIVGAVIASTGRLHPEWVFLAAAIGNLSADLGWYMLGYWGRFEVLATRFGWLRKHQVQITRLEHEMNQHAFKILLVGKLTLSMSIPALIAAGMRPNYRMVFHKHCLPCFLGNVSGQGA